MRKVSIVIALLVALAAASPAAAAQSPVVGDCVAHGQLTQTYSAGQLKTALNTMSAAVKEYTNCSDVIQRALLNDIQGVHPTKSGSGSGGGSFLPTPVIVVIVLLALAGVTFGAIAIRRRGAAAESPRGGGDPPGEQ